MRGISAHARQYDARGFKSLVNEEFAGTDRRKVIEAALGALPEGARAELRKQLGDVIEGLEPKPEKYALACGAGGTSIVIGNIEVVA